MECPAGSLKGRDADTCLIKNEGWHARPDLVAQQAQGGLTPAHRARPLRRGATLCTHDLIPVDTMTGSFKLTRKYLFPASAVIHRRPNDAGEIAWDFNLPAFESTYLASAQATNEVSQLQKHILSGSGLRRSSLYAALIVWRKQNYCETNVTVSNDFFDNCSSLVSLFVQDDSFKPNPFKKSRHCFTSAIIVTMNNKDLTRKLSF
jgi:hypothetical protein